MNERVNLVSKNKNTEIRNQEVLLYLALAAKGKLLSVSVLNKTFSNSHQLILYLVIDFYYFSLILYSMIKFLL